MVRTLMHFLAAVIALSLGGCLGDRAADRTLEIHQIQSTSTYDGPFEIDVSQLPPGAVKTKVNSGGAGTPVTSLTIDQECSFRVVLVPITQAESSLPAAKPSEKKY
ncbi:MAG: hypothetical protein IT426_14970 [Pirellulales bacterium]|nr:hypothetical protein [Pirellulales bacterium]